MLKQTIGFIGAGQMARALAQGFVRAGLLAEKQIVAADPVEAAQTEFKRLLPGASVVASNADVAARSDIIVLAVKPQQAKTAMAELRGKLGNDKLLISIVTGIRLQSLADGLGPCRIGPRHAKHAMPGWPERQRILFGTERHGARCRAGRTVAWLCRNRLSPLKKNF